MQGDKRAFKRLYNRWHPSLLRFAFRLTHNAEDSQDVMQDAAITIAKSIHRLQNPASFGPWAYTIVRRRAHDHIDKSIRQRRIKTELAASYRPKIVDDSERSFALKQALEALSTSDRALLMLFYIDGMTGPELSAAMDVPIGTIKSRISAARSKLKAIYEAPATGGSDE